MTTFNTNFLNYLQGFPGSPPAGIAAGVAGIMTGVLAGGGSVGTANRGGVIYLYSANGNALPTDPDAAMDTSKYTLLAKIRANPGSNYGVTFDAASGGVISKATGETWQTGTLPGSYIAGLNFATANNLTIDYAIFANLHAGDTDGAAACPANCPRVLMSVGQIGTGTYDIMLSSNILANNGSLTLSGFQFD